SGGAATGGPGASGARRGGGDGVAGDRAAPGPGASAARPGVGGRRRGGLRGDDRRADGARGPPPRPAGRPGRERAGVAARAGVGGGEFRGGPAPRPSRLARRARRCRGPGRLGLGADRPRAGGDDAGERLMREPAARLALAAVAVSGLLLLLSAPLRASAAASAQRNYPQDL